VQALVVHSPGDAVLEERPAPVARSDEILVRPTLIGICGTDLDIVDGSIDPDFVRYPIVLGHEWTGVVETGVVPTGMSDTESPPVGARVVVEGIVPCGHCARCVAGDTNRCATYDEFGFTRDGAATGLIAVPSRLAHVVADGVPSESAVLVEPAAVVLRALSRAAPSPGQRVLVIGDGTVGLLAARLSRLWSPASVTLLGLRTDQAALATAAGVDDFTTRPLSGDFDLVVEAAGSAESTRTALRAPTRGGTVVLLGYPGKDANVPFPVDDVVNGDIAIVGSFGYTSTAWRQLVGLLNAGQLDLSFLVTHRFPLQDWESAMSTLRAGTGARAKVVLEPAFDSSAAAGR
jgi:2-desacetyl-2-hydroxyethyl bacteriochlorophyllide A dehydrogenase